MEQFMKLVDCGVLSRNELRAIFGMNPIAGGDERTVLTPHGPIPLLELPEYFKRVKIE